MSWRSAWNRLSRLQLRAHPFSDYNASRHVLNKVDAWKLRTDSSLTLTRASQLTERLLKMTSRRFNEQKRESSIGGYRIEYERKRESGIEMLQDKGEFTSTCVAKNSKRYSLPRLSSLFSLREREKRSENRSALETALYPVTKMTKRRPRATLLLPARFRFPLLLLFLV